MVSRNPAYLTTRPERQRAKPMDPPGLARHQPDVVLLEVAERNLNRLAREPRQLTRACDDLPVADGSHPAQGDG